MSAICVGVQLVKCLLHVLLPLLHISLEFLKLDLAIMVLVILLQEGLDVVLATRQAQPR